jgi:omega-hydroxy-beta-dihydromenaquinone-9 sulfotransferase
MTFGVWVRFLYQHSFRVHWSVWHVAFSITLFSIFNSFASLIQSLIYGRKIRNQDNLPPPIFIVGHWRSGTTHLHELMIHDQRFGFPTTYECFAPSHFLVSEWIGPLIKWMLPNKRPMDNMTAGWKHPQEDEFALCNLGLGSPYERLAFPNQPLNPNDFLVLENQSAAEQEHWSQGLKWFWQAVQLRCPNKQIVFKSPPHTARLKVLSELFPGAKFIHIVRDPLAVYPSTMRLWKSLYQIQGLQPTDHADLQEYVLRNFERMYQNFEVAREQFSDEQLYELRYEDLVRDPLAELQKIYSHFELGDFAEVREQIRAYLETQKDYQTNKHQLDAETRELLVRRWGKYMQHYGYLEPTPVKAIA